MKLYRGVVENNNNIEQKNGSVKVRIVGIHTENNENNADDFETISTDNLPWAEVSQGTLFGLNSGIGISSVLKQGTWVWVVLENGDQNKPVVIGVISGTSTVKKDYSQGEGFCDPDGVFPLDDRLGENDLNELARGIIAKTVIQAKNDNLDSWAEYSETAQAPSVYPNNTVIETLSGHIIELDDTPGNERFQIIDKTGNYIELKTQEFITKAINEKINIIMKNLKEHVAGGVKQQIDKDFHKIISGYFKIQASGGLEIINDVKISGGLLTTGTISSESDVTAGGEVADGTGNLSSLRNTYDIHDHIGNLGIPTAPPTLTDPVVRTTDFVWSKTELGFS